MNDHLNVEAPLEATVALVDIPSPGVASKNQAGGAVQVATDAKTEPPRAVLAAAVARSTADLENPVAQEILEADLKRKSRAEKESGAGLAQSLSGVNPSELCLVTTGNSSMRTTSVLLQ